LIFPSRNIVSLKIKIYLFLFIFIITSCARNPLIRRPIKRSVTSLPQKKVLNICEDDQKKLNSYDRYFCKIPQIILSLQSGDKSYAEIKNFYYKKKSLNRKKKKLLTLTKNKKDMEENDFPNLTLSLHFLFNSFKNSKKIALNYENDFNQYQKERTPKNLKRMLISMTASFILLENHRFFSKAFNLNNDITKVQKELRATIKIKILQTNYRSTPLETSIFQLKYLKYRQYYNNFYLKGQKIKIIHSLHKKRRFKLSFFKRPKKSGKEIFKMAMRDRPDWFTIHYPQLQYLASYINYDSPYIQNKNIPLYFESMEKFYIIHEQTKKRLKYLNQKSSPCQKKDDPFQKGYCKLHYGIVEILNTRRTSLDIYTYFNKRFKNKTNPPTEEELKVFFENFQTALDTQKLLENIKNKFQHYIKDFKTLNPDNLGPFLLGLSSTLLILEHFEQTFMLFQNHPVMRRILDRGDKMWGRHRWELYQQAKAYSSKKTCHLASIGLKKYNLIKRSLNTHHHSQTRFLSIIINNSGKDKLGKYRFLNCKPNLINKTRRSFRRLSDSIKSLMNKVAFDASKLFGLKLAGIKFRDGHLKKLLKKHPEEITFIKNKVRPLDIFNSKHRSKVSSYSIPGFWSHNGIYIGNKNQLKAVGLWDDPAFSFWYKWNIENESILFESDKPGTGFNDFQKAMREADDFLILRPKVFKILKRELPEILHSQGREETIKTNGKVFKYITFNNNDDDLENWSEGKKYTVRFMLKQSLKNDGKKYGFDFDILNPEQIVCSELIRKTFTYIDFKSTFIAKRFTISPSEVALEANPGGTLLPIVFYMNAKRLQETGEDLARILQCMQNIECQSHFEKTYLEGGDYMKALKDNP
jgi:hypothetical protein